MERIKQQAQTINLKWEQSFKHLVSPNPVRGVVMLYIGGYSSIQRKYYVYVSQPRAPILGYAHYLHVHLPLKFMNQSSFRAQLTVYFLKMFANWWQWSHTNHKPMTHRLHPRSTGRMECNESLFHMCATVYGSSLTCLKKYLVGRDIDVLYPSYIKPLEPSGYYMYHQP
jgi:hypothetical protein